MPEFRFFTNHAMVFSHIAQKPRITARELSNIIGITERATLKIINDLLEENYLTKTREGRNNRYRVKPERVISPPGLDDVTAEAILKALGWRKRGRPRKS
ncbi:MAG: helix-turn-helix domain-containing protein [Dehalococcoidales bacterium]|nr:helix-turn-helix domain-containing protein [Dehalococcoidales bacterium]